MKGSLVRSLFGRQSVYAVRSKNGLFGGAGGEELGLVGNRRALCGEDLYPQLEMPCPAHSLSRSNSTPLHSRNLDAFDRFGVDLAIRSGLPPIDPV